jgi:CAAX prenyl protease-like protein
VKRIIPHVAPYAAYVAIGAAGEHVAPYTDAIRIALVGGMLLHWWRREAYAELETAPTAGQVLLGALSGLAVGAAWVPLAKLVPSLYATERTGLDPGAGVVLTCLRAVDMVLVVPFTEELMVRSAVPRFVDSRDGEDWRVRPVGVFTRTSLVASIGFFTLTHPEWLAALATALLWTAILAKTRNLRVLVIAHAVANAWLAGHVIVTGEKQWW